MGVLEYRIGWNAAGTNPGVTVMHGRIPAAIAGQVASQSFADRCQKLMDDVKTLVAGATVWSFPGEVTELNTVSGDLEAVHVITPPANVTSTAAGNYSAPSGARIEWRTDAIVAGRRLRGRTFFVPLGAGVYDATGTLSTTTLTALTTAANNFKSNSVFGASQGSVWSRTHGIQADITSAFIPDEASVLRSRRE